jgi:hypothetical protein
VDFSDPQNVKRLVTAVEESRLRMQPYRAKVTERIRDMVGSHYSDNGTTCKMPINLLALALFTYRQRLISGTPRVLATTHNQAWRGTALEMEAGINDCLIRISAAREMREVVMDALLGMGIMKVGVCQYKHGHEDDPGQVGIWRVSLDDWVHDMTCTSYRDAAFSGHRYRVPYSTVMNDPDIAPEIKDRLKPTNKSLHDEQGDPLAASISQGDTSYDKDEIQDYIELWELWLPDERRIVTLPASQSHNTLDGLVLRDVQWTGPKSGPYRILAFQGVPSNSLPLPPAATWQDLNDAANILMAKLIRQAERQKSNLLFQRGNDLDAERIAKSADGEAIGVDNPSGAQEASWGGPSANNLAFTIQLRQLFSYMSGNLDVLGGLSQGADTLGQEKILNEQTSATIRSMQSDVLDWVQDICVDVGFWLLSDPLLNVPLQKRVPGSTLDIPFRLTPDRLRGGYNDYTIQVEPYSLQRKTPSERLQALMATLQQVVMPLAPILQAQQISPNAEGILKMIARYADQPELEQDMLFFGGPSTVPELPGDPHGKQMGPAGGTTRNYRRISESASKQNPMQGAEQDMMGMLSSLSADGGNTLGIGG